MSDQDPDRPWYEREPEPGDEGAAAEQPTVEQAALEAAAAEQAAYAAAAGEQPVYEPIAGETPAEPVYEQPVYEEQVYEQPAPEPTPVVGPADATPDAPAGTAFPQHAPPAPIGEERPEILVGAAFGGGLIAAMLLKGLARRKHR